MREDIERSQARVDDLVREAQERGVPTARIRQQAQIDRLRADAEKRLKALRDRIDAALDGG